jgi:hypothetical protein
MGRGRDWGLLDRNLRKIPLLPERQSQHDYFRTIMTTVLGQAMHAAGYTLADQPYKWIAGHYQWRKTLEAGTAIIAFQLLAYTETTHAPSMPSRFRITLTRPMPAATRTLSALVVEDFGVAILPSADHWWTFRSTTELGQTLQEAGYLLIGYGLSWLAGETPQS